ncbi:MAG: SprT family zinc-dependent metalloprotease [Candidatus Nealsonbacteria bacterium]|nr:SprT family zinc-dependent metalloprotease [Candidatus Nealsonbacteria bacterium]
MKKIIKIRKRKVEYTFRVSRRARRMRLAIYCDGNFVVTAPQGTDLNMVEGFIAAKSRWIINKLDYFKSSGKRIFIKTNRADFLKYRQKARLFVESRIQFFNKPYQFKFNKINIKNQKTRWGSCSKKGNLNFNYKILLLPPYIADYIIAHELCHLIEFNHSGKFWNFLKKLVPDCLEIRRELKRVG